MKRAILLIVLIAFLALTGVALWEFGYIGFFKEIVSSSAGLQVFFDLTIALTLFLIWLWHDARNAGRSPWPWIILTLCSGSIAALIYLLIYKSGESETSP